MSGRDRTWCRLIKSRESTAIQSRRFWVHRAIKSSPSSAWNARRLTRSWLSLNSKFTKSMRWWHWLASTWKISGDRTRRSGTVKMPDKDLKMRGFWKFYTDRRKKTELWIKTSKTWRKSRRFSTRSSWHSRSRWTNRSWCRETCLKKRSGSTRVTCEVLRTTTRPSTPWS